jgi:hypothetical protein
MKREFKKLLIIEELAIVWPEMLMKRWTKKQTILSV